MPQKLVGILIGLMIILSLPKIVFAENNDDQTDIPVEIISTEVTEFSSDSWAVECIVKNNADIDLRYVDICVFVCNEDGGRMNAPSARTDDIIEPGQTATLTFSGTEPNAAYLQFCNYFYTFVDETTYYGEFEEDAIVVDFIDRESMTEEPMTEEPVTEEPATEEHMTEIILANDSEKEEPVTEAVITDNYESVELETEKATTEEKVENETEIEVVYDESIDGQPLIRDDFIIELDNVEGNSEYIDRLAMYDNDISLYLDAVYRDGGYVYFNIERDIEDIEISDSSLYGFTYRGIIPDESSKEDVLNAYGIGIDYNYVMETDPIYERMENSGEQDLLAYILEHYVAEVMVYSYKNQYQIAFYLDATGDVITIVYTNWIAYKADKATVLFVQGMLNRMGYVCGDTDGIAGPITSAAVEEYQKNNGLFVSGVIDDELLKSLNAQGENSVDEENISAQEVETTDSGADYSMLMEAYLDDITEDAGAWSYIGGDNLIPTPDSCLKDVSLQTVENNIYLYASDEQNEENLNEMTAAYSLVLMLDCDFALEPVEGTSEGIEGIYLNDDLIAYIAKTEDPDWGLCLGIAILD